MELNVFDQSLKELSRRAPFKPFVVEMSSGSSIEVKHPEALAFHEGLAVYISTGGVPMFFDHTSVTRLIGAPVSGSAEAG
ncbi:MAG TPA: hypothetical protein VEO95_01855 [Chthoniobacteraceae bacterium]|nr:hypothetical protein [Chthoniobacteraceae bacterium]